MSGLYEALFRRVLFPLYESGLRRRKTLAYLAEYERSQHLSREQLDAVQWRKLERLLAHCWAEVPYYARRWRESGAEPGDIRTPADFARLPRLTKQDIRDNFEDLHARSHREGLIYKKTGGSTGEPMKFGYTRESYERRIAAMWRGYGWAGAHMGRRTLYVWGAPVIDSTVGTLKTKDRLYHAAFNRRVVNAFLMRDENLPEFAQAFDDFRPEVVVGYVGPLLRIAEWLNARKRTVHRPQAILSAAEALHARQREVLEATFGAPVYNTYGCREFMLIASECGERKGLHATADHLVVEVDAPLRGVDGEPVGEILVTDLHNYGMPFVRYANGDLAVPSSRTCACGRGLPLLERIEGRRLDCVRTPAGGLVPGEFFINAFFGVDGIKRYQVVQRELGALDIMLVRGPDFSERSVEQVRAEVRKAVDESVELRLHFVDDIPMSRSGKFRVSISELP